MNRRWLIIPALTLGATVLPVALEAASAHANAVTGKAVCESNGTYTVTWTIANDYNLTETATVTDFAPTPPSTLDRTSVNIAKNGSATVVQTVVPGSATAATMSVHGKWTDNVTNDASGNVSLGGTCKRQVTIVKPTFRDGDCTTAPSMDIPAATADFGVAVTGTAGFGNTVTVTFTAKPGVELVGQKTYTYTFKPRAEGCDTTTTATTTTTTMPTTTTSSTTTTSTTTTEPATSTTTTIAPSLGFQVLGPVCVADIPYIHWTLAGGGLGGQSTATITITDVNGNVVETLTNQPFDGQTLWPGASLDPEDWPGWVKIGGVWYTDPSDAVLRQGVFVSATVASPSGQQTQQLLSRPESLEDVTVAPQLVSYPEATAACAQPAIEAVAAPAIAQLPVTGRGTGTAWIAALFVALGTALVVLARRRCRPS